MGSLLSRCARTHESLQCDETYEPLQSDEVLATAGLVPGSEKERERGSKGADGAVMASFWVMQSNFCITL